MSGTFDQHFTDADRVPGQPIPIKATIGEAAPFPVEQLSPKLQAAIKAIVDIAQVPPSIAGQSVLGAAALAAQCRINVKLPTREVMPVSLFLFSVASSGDRKSTADTLALRPIYDREREMRERYVHAQSDYVIRSAAHKAAVAAATKAGGGDRQVIFDKVQAVGREPLSPPLPMLLVDEATMEGLVRLLGDAMPSLGLFSDEGAQMLGGYSMGDEKKGASGGQLSQMWDGKPIKRVRAGDVIQFLAGRRVSLHLMVQPGVAMKFFGDKVTRDQGLQSRMLCAFPRSLKGSRMWSTPSEEIYKDLDEYHSRLSRLLDPDLTYANDTSRELQLETVSLQPDAEEMAINFSDHIEGLMKPGGQLEEISDLASKLMQHAVRLAAVIAYWEGGTKVIEAGISLRAMAVGIQLAQFYAGEALRLYGAGTIDEDSENASVLIDFIRKKEMTVVGMRWLSQSAPKMVRAARTLKRAVELLIEMGHLHEIKGGAHIDVNGKSVFNKEAYTVLPGDPE